MAGKLQEGKEKFKFPQLQPPIQMPECHQRDKTPKYFRAIAVAAGGTPKTTGNDGGRSQGMQCMSRGVIYHKI